MPCTASGVALVSGMHWRRCGAMMCFDVSQAVQYSRMCIYNSVKTRQIVGKVPVKPCALFCGMGGIICIDTAKHAVNACVWLIRFLAKEKPCTLSRCKAKEKPRHRGRG